MTHRMRLPNSFAHVDIQDGESMALAGILFILPKPSGFGRRDDHDCLIASLKVGREINVIFEHGTPHDTLGDREER